MSWWTSVALPAISRTVDPTGTLAKAVTRATTASSGKEVARTFLDPLNVTKYLVKKKDTTATAGKPVTSQTEELIETAKTYLLNPLVLVIIGIVIVVIFLIRRR